MKDLGKIMISLKIRLEKRLSHMKKFVKKININQLLCTVVTNLNNKKLIK